MSFKSGKTVHKELPKENKVDPYKGLPFFSEEDFAFLFFKLKNTEFKGEEMESFYNLTLKLQNLYTFLKSRNQIKK
jgi:hypothetical protein